MPFFTISDYPFCLSANLVFSLSVNESLDACEYGVTVWKLPESGGRTGSPREELSGQQAPPLEKKCTVPYTEEGDPIRYSIRNLNYLNRLISLPITLILIELIANWCFRFCAWDPAGGDRILTASEARLIVWSIDEDSPKVILSALVDMIQRLRTKEDERNSSYALCVGAHERWISSVQG